MPFPAEPHTAALTCCHVLDGSPVLFVAHDDDGDWQFLCGAESHSTDVGKVVGLGHLVDGDPTLVALEDLACGHHAERASRTAAWFITDTHEAFIHRCVADPGWAVQLIPAEGDQPAFAYTVGLFRNYRQPELIVVGLRPELMHAMVNEIAGRMKSGTRCAAGDRLREVIDGFEVELRAVTDRTRVGYARWFYAGAPFQLLQVVWPDQQQRFPDDPNAAGAFKRQQPLLP